MEWIENDPNDPRLISNEIKRFSGNGPSFLHFNLIPSFLRQSSESEQHEVWGMRNEKGKKLSNFPWCTNVTFCRWKHCSAKLNDWRFHFVVVRWKDVLGGTAELWPASVRSGAIIKYHISTELTSTLGTNKLELNLDKPKSESQL